MKRFLISLFAVLLITLLAGCDSMQNDNFDATLLPGYWQSGTVHEYFDADGTGYTWDTADDVTEEEAQSYTWTISGSTLTLTHQMEMGGVVPKTYTLTRLNATTLSYYDSYGSTYVFTRQ